MCQETLLDETKFKPYIPSTIVQGLNVSEEDKGIWLQFQKLEHLVHQLQVAISNSPTFQYFVLPFSAPAISLPFFIP